MGIGDTRALDFNNVAILTMNEKVFPRRGSRKSFIPDVIRKSFGLPPSRTDENRAAYLFYSLIARARRVSIYYDTRKGRSGGDASRYISFIWQIPINCVLSVEASSLSRSPQTLFQFQKSRRKLSRH